MKTIIIGIDGGTWDVMLPLIKKGELPNIARLMETGVWGNLHSTYPPITVPAWVSCVTGVNPGKLGVFDWINNPHENYEGHLVNPTEVTIKRIWDILGEQGKKIILVTVPFTHPPSPVNGIVVSSARPRQPQVILTYPKELIEEVKKITGIYDLFQFKKELGIKDQAHQMQGEVYLERIFKIHMFALQKLEKLLFHVLEKYPWDFFMTVFSSTDVIQHHFWGYQDPTHPLFTDKMNKKFGNVIEVIYRKIDEIIGNMLKIISVENVNIFIVSDHGFGPYHKNFYVNHWLIQRGWLRLKKNLRKPAIKFISFRNIKVPIPWLQLKPWRELIDWNETQAYAHFHGGININLKGREPSGIVSKKEAPKILEQIKRELFELKDPQTEEKIVKEVKLREEIYWGDYIEKAPDLIFFFKDTRYFPKKEIFVKELSAIFKPVNYKDIITGHHYSAFNGIFVLNSPFIKPGTQVNNAHIIDITPTALYLMGLPVPEEMDGRVWLEVVKPEFQKKYPLKGIKYNLYKEEKEVKFSVEEEEKIKKQLKDMGYLG